MTESHVSLVWLIGSLIWFTVSLAITVWLKLDDESDRSRDISQFWEWACPCIIAWPLVLGAIVAGIVGLVGLVLPIMGLIWVFDNVTTRLAEKIKERRGPTSSTIQGDIKGQRKCAQ